MLQLALLENIRRVALRIAGRREELNAAISWADRMLATAEKEPKQLIQLLAEFANADVPLTAPFVEEFYARLQAQGSQWHCSNLGRAKIVRTGITATQLSKWLVERLQPIRSLLPTVSVVCVYRYHGWESTSNRSRRCNIT
jgi:dienelactone hydrolase